jgi:hypothetical protein
MRHRTLPASAIDDRRPLTNAPTSDASTSSAWLTVADVREFQELMRSECGIGLDEAAAWNRLAELVAFYRMVLGPVPEDRGASVTPEFK